MEDFELASPTFDQPHPWLRLHRNISENKKLMSVLLKDREAFLFWTLFLTCTDNAGKLLSAEDIAWKYRAILEKAEIEQQLSNLTALRLIDSIDGALYMHDWSEHQKRTDISGAERVRAYRERQKEKQRQSLAPEPPPMPPLFDASGRNVTLTPLDTEKETDIEKEKELPRASAQASPVPLSENPKHRKQEVHPPDPTEAETCWNDFLDLYPAAGKKDINTAARSFNSLWGRPAPKSSLDTKGCGIPDREYFQAAVLPGLKAALKSERWSDPKFIHSMTTFLTGNPTKNTFGFMWLDEWPESKESIAERRAAKDFYVAPPKKTDSLSEEDTERLAAQLAAKVGKKRNGVTHQLASGF